MSALSLLGGKTRKILCLGKGRRSQRYAVIKYPGRWRTTSSGAGEPSVGHANRTKQASAPEKAKKNAFLNLLFSLGDNFVSSKGLLRFWGLGKKID